MMSGTVWTSASIQNHVPDSRKAATVSTASSLFAGWVPSLTLDETDVNVVMDFVFAAFPWIITWNLDMRRKEKIGLCLTMSLGLVVAIASAIRTEWKYDGNRKDEWYFWNNAMSNIWYSSEVTGTIIVQCVPVLRPLLKHISTTMRSKRLGSSTDDGGTFGLSKLDGHVGRWYPPSRLKDEGGLIPGPVGDEETLILSVRNGIVARKDMNGDRVHSDA